MILTISEYLEKQKLGNTGSSELKCKYLCIIKKFKEVFLPSQQFPLRHHLKRKRNFAKPITSWLIEIQCLLTNFISLFINLRIPGLYYKCVI